MITLATASQTTSTTVFNGVTAVNTTDTLFISYIEIGFGTGTVSAMIQKGTMVNGAFTSNLPMIRVNVNPDGSFSSNDPSGPKGGWSGTIPNWSATLAALAAPLDGLLVAAALVQGTAVPNTALTAVQAK